MAREKYVDKLGPGIFKSYTNSNIFYRFFY